MRRFFIGNLVKVVVLSAISVVPCYRAIAEDLVEAFERPIQVPKVRLETDRIESPRGKLDLERTDAELRAAEEAILGGVRLQKTSSPKVSSPPRVVPSNRTQQEKIPAEVIQALDSAAAAGIVTPAQREMILPTKRTSPENYWNESEIPVAKKAIPTDPRLGNLQEENNKLRQDLEEMKDLLRDLQSTKDRLMVAETEVERLEKIISTRNNAALQVKPTNVKYVQNAARSESVEDSDLPIVTVQVEKANLRAAPGTQHSVIMEVAKGTRLVVETRKGDWYRVTTPNGKRAWVASEVVAFGPSGGSAPTRTVKVKGYDDSIEELSYEQPRSGRSE